MPTPIGHALAGLATAWFSPCRRSKTVVALCVAAAIAADLDILIHQHRTFTHSVGAVVIVAVIAWGIARFARTRTFAASPAKESGPALVLTIAAAYGTHIVLDWLGKDTAPPFGLMALWPLSSRYYISGANLFMEISRRYWKPDEFIVGNLKAGAWEVLVLAPIVALAWYVNSPHRKR
jgi:membrane-bound metal-dependent hydrolase YbcI (DUF457 family)